jgi:hypothetical protein
LTHPQMSIAQNHLQCLSENMLHHSSGASSFSRRSWNYVKGELKTADSRVEMEIYHDIPWYTLTNQWMLIGKQIVRYMGIFIHGDIPNQLMNNMKETKCLSNYPKCNCPTSQCLKFAKRSLEFALTYSILFLCSVPRAISQRFRPACFSMSCVLRFCWLYLIFSPYAVPCHKTPRVVK